MSLDERIQQLDQRIANLVQQAVGDFRKEIGQRLSEEVLQKLAQAPAHLPTSFVSAEGLQPLAEEAAAVGGRQAVATVRDSLLRLDEARSQADILNALLAESSHFASRAAVFLTRPDGASGWGAQGLGEIQIRGLAVDYRDGGPWSRLAEGRSCIALQEEDCATMAERLGATASSAGLLIPLVLRDRVAAALYVDHGEDGNPPQMAALQVLAYAAAMAIETLPFRSRGKTPTLVSETDAQGSDVGLGLWDTGAVTAAAVAAQAPPAEPTEPAELSMPPSPPSPPSPPVEPAPEYEASVEAEPVELAAPSEASLEAVPAQEEEASEVSALDTQSSGLSAPSWSAPSEPAVEVSEFIVEDVAEDQDDTAVTAVEATPEVAAETSSEALAWEEEPTFEAEPAFDAEEEPAFETAAEPAPEAPSLAWEPEEASEAEVEYTPVADAEATPAAARETQVPATVDVDPADTVLLPRDLAGMTAEPAVVAEPTVVEEPAEVAEPEAAPEPEAPAAEAKSGGGLFGGGGGGAPGRPTQVAPPEDIDGPGRAFGGVADEAPPESGDDTAHEEARRLARLLVSEIKLYNEEQVDEGRRNGNIYNHLREDIDRSRQMYEERTDERVRNSTDYFYQELVRLLAAGDAKALGI